MLKGSGRRAGTAMMVVLLLSAVLVVAVGVGYSASQPVLGDGSAFLGKGHTVAHVNGETGKSDAEVAQRLATGKEELQPVYLPDGRLVIVNKTTGTISTVNGATLAPEGPPTVRPTAAGQLEPVATEHGGYLIDKSRNTVEQVVGPDAAPPPPVEVPQGIVAAVPCADSVWLTTRANEIIEVRAGRAQPAIPFDQPLVGLTVADGHPVAVTEDGHAYTVDGEHRSEIGDGLGLSGRSLILGGWQSAGRYVVAVDPATGKFAAIDHRTGNRSMATLAVLVGRAKLGAPVVLDSFAYVPDYSGPSLWRVNLSTGRADSKPLKVPGQPGAFELKVIGRRVWANNQYDRRALVVDADGHDHYADKGTGPEMGDTEGGSGPPAGSGPTAGADADPGDSGSTGGPPGQPSNATVTIPTFPRGTQYRDACEALKALSLKCRPVAGGDDSGLRTGEVRGTDPAGGTMVPVGTPVVVRYVGPVRTPDVVGELHNNACRQIQAARLKCAEQIDPSPAPSTNQLLQVSTQDPAARALVDKGTTVTITYYNSIGLPTLIDLQWTEACLTVTGPYRMLCDPVAGDPPPAGKQPGQVYFQDGLPGAVATVGSTVHLRYYRGSSTPRDLTGSNVDAACAELAGLGLACTKVEGSCAWNSGHAVGEVAQQRPPGGTRVAVGDAVTLVHYTDLCDVPGYVGGNAQNACADLAARGFGCNAVAEPAPSTNEVTAQDQPAGRYRLGTAITIHYSPWALIDWWIVQYGAGWKLVPGGGAFRVGYGYAGGDFDVPGGRHVNEFICSSGDCNGYPTNVFYSGVPSYPGFTKTDNFVTFMTCTGDSRQRHIYRMWNAGMPRAYKITDNLGQYPGFASEDLGCVW